MSKSTFKTYAKEAKDRLKSGFWEGKYADWDKIEREAESNGTNADKVITEEKAKLSVMLYNRKKYDDEQLFYKRVCEIMESSEVVTNPISLLCEAEGLNELPSEQRARKAFEIAEKYREMVARYEKEKQQSADK